MTWAKRTAVVAAIGAAVAGGLLISSRPRRESRPAADVPSRPTPAPSPARPQAVESPPRPIDALLGEYARLHERESPLAERKKAEQEIEAQLSYVGPNETVDLLLSHPATASVSVLLRGVDNGLVRDRAAWEAALAAGLERAGDDAVRLEGFAALFLERIRDEARRGRAAVRLARTATSDGLVLLAARTAAGEALAPVRDLLWARVPEKGAVEGLGWLIGPDEATRLESLGAGTAVVRALEIALERTGDPAFRESLRRLGK
jgi:hypothetical protein